MIEKNFQLKHYIAISLLLIAIIVSGINPLEFEAYLLHQSGTVLMLILLFIIFKKIGLDFLSFVLFTVSFNTRNWCSLSIFIRSV